MNKKYLLGMALMASMAFYSCTEEKIYVQGGEGSEQVAEDVQTITLQVENSGDGLTTRAARPLYSAEAKQTIENVKVIVCNGENNVVYTKDFTNWNDNQTSTVYENNGHGRQATIKLEGDEKLGQGSYTVYAIGYHNTSGYKDNTGATSLNDVMTGITKGETFNADMVLKYTGSSNAEEIFAGSAELSISDKKAGSATVILNRQVAGAFVYLKDIPYYADATKIELVASTTNDQLVLGQFANTNFESNGGNSVAMNVINGWNSSQNSAGQAVETVIATITLSDWFNNGIKDDDTNGLIDTDNWQNPYIEDNHPTFQKGSVFAGTFLIPFAKVESTQTLKLVMKDESDKQYAFWNVNLSGTRQNYSNLFTWNQNTWSGGIGTTEDLNKNSYSIVRNHLYGIGTRMSDIIDPNNPDKDPDPTKPEEKPNEEEDKPESLNNKQELILQVNDNWEVIHGMELE